MDIIGELRQDTTEDGRPYFEMSMGDKKYMVFANLYKTEEDQPDFLIFDGCGLDAVMGEAERLAKKHYGTK